MYDYVDVNPKTDCSSLHDDIMVSFVPMPNLQEKNNLVTYDSVPYSQVKKGFTVFAKGDLIWAKITPCMQNGKSCITDKMPTGIGFGSTEFHVIRKRCDDVYMPFLWAIFSNEDVLKAAQATFSGSAGQQRVPASFLENFPAVIPEYDLQVKLVAELENKLAKKNEKYQEAIEILNEQEKSTAKRCGLESSINSRLCYAIRYSQLDGVIDAKRYATIRNANHAQVISDICDIVKEKVNASAYGNQTVDWIRIDDLPNQPLDIESVRTQPATEIEGNFFKVKVGDILVARLGPTIMNQKIVMVRKIDRETIASSEFLVLRCKRNVDPEAVMAVLRTQYYKNLMFSHARGSTPSRYRLNREDMLDLPFPLIVDNQKELATLATLTRKQVSSLREQAEQEWSEARANFEKKLLGE